MKLTEKGLKQTEALLQKDDGAREYMKQVAKHFQVNAPDKESVNIKEIADEIDIIEDTKLSIYERYNIPENDNLKNYQVFCKLLDKVQKSKISERNKLGFEQTTSLMSNAKYFEIPENINLLLSNTSNRVREVKLPFYFIFLDTKITVYDRNYYCFFLSDYLSLKKMALEKGKRLDHLPNTISILTFYETEEGMGYNLINLYEKGGDKYKRKVREYIMNFIDFVNSEDIKLMFNQRTEKNTERRVQKGRLPLPSFNKIRVVGYLAKYLKELEETEGLTRFSHRFWVRGHFRHFYNKKFDGLYKLFKEGKLKNQKRCQYIMDNSGALKVWIFPFIKGEGILINKKYKLK